MSIFRRNRILPKSLITNSSRAFNLRLKRAAHRMFRVFHLLVILMLTLMPASPLGAISAYAEGTPALVIEKAEFAPDEIVMVNGSGFETGDVALPVMRPDGTIASGMATADEGGAFTYEYISDGGDGSYEVRAYPADWSGDWSVEPLSSVTFSVTSPPPTTEEPAPTEEPTTEPTEEPAPTEEPTPESTEESTPTEEPTAELTEETTPAPPPTIQSDKSDYTPGETVTLTGANWQPGEVVNIHVNDDWGSSWSRDVDVTAADDGTIVDVFTLPTWFVATYTVIVTGGVSGTAMITFTDGPLPSSVKAFSWETVPSGNWIQGTLNANNSDYKEGETVPFRIEMSGNAVPESGNPWYAPICRDYANTPTGPYGYTTLQDFNTSRSADPGGTIINTLDHFSGVRLTVLDVYDPVASSGTLDSNTFNCGSTQRLVIVKFDATGSGNDSRYLLWGGRLSKPGDTNPDVAFGNSSSYYPGGSLQMRLASPDKTAGINPAAVIQLAKITVTKVVDSGSATPDQWCFTVIGLNSYNVTQCIPSGQSSVDFIGLDTGTYTPITESTIEGYAFSGDGPNENCSFGGTSTATANVTAAAGGATNASCIFHNAQQDGWIQLDKDFIGITESVTLKIGRSVGSSDVDSEVLNGDGTTGENTVSAGTYYVSEDLTTPANYIVSLACFDDVNDNDLIDEGEPSHLIISGNSVEIGPLDDVICLFTNTEDFNVTHAEIQLDKLFVGATESVTINIGTDQDPSDVDTAALSGDGSTGENLVNIGMYYMSEVLTNPGNYDVNLECFNDEDDSDTINEVDTMHSVNTITGAVFLAGSDDVICRFTNSRLPQLKLVKDAQSDDGGTLTDGDYTLSAAAAEPDNGRNFSDNGDSSVGVFHDVFAGVEYALSESPDPGTGYSSSGEWSCTGGTLNTAKNAVTLALGEAVTCTIVNDDIAPTLKLVKEIITLGVVYEEPDDWTLSARKLCKEGDPDPNCGFSDLGGSGTFHEVLANTAYKLFEEGPDGYTAGAWECDGGSLVGNKITLDLDDDVTCTIKNYRLSFVTDSALCFFDRDPEIEGRDFRLLFTPDIQNWPSYKLTASNPGQFYYNVFVDVNGPISKVNLEIPYPFVTQGAMPIHAYDDVTPIDRDGDGLFDCLEPPEDAMMAWGDQITLDSYSLGSIGDTHTISLDVSDLEGLVYVNIHLDYGLKGSDPDGDGVPNGYDKELRLVDPSDPASETLYDAIEYGSPGNVLIPDRWLYIFATAFDGIEHEDSVINVNEFKKIPGVAGFVFDGGELYTVGDLEVWLHIPESVKDVGGDILKSPLDEDGWYMIEYKHKGKPTEYLIELCKDGIPIPGSQDWIELKGNAFVEYNFSMDIP